MKKIIIVLTVASLSLMAFKTNTMVIEKKKRITSSEQMAERIVAALQHSSAKEYAAMFPSLSDFKELMTESSEIYGAYLPEAQREFAIKYETQLVPTVEHAFEVLIDEGRAKGIDWSAIRYVGIESEEQTDHRYGAVPVTIVVSSNGEEHRIRIERALVFHGQWKVTQFIKLA